jgi:hypothetical protein
VKSSATSMKSSATSVKSAPSPVATTSTLGVSGLCDAKK